MQQTVEQFLASPPQESVVNLRPGESYKLTDLGNSERLIAQHGSNLRYCHPEKRWYVWNARYWEHDKTGTVASLAAETIRGIDAEVAFCDDADRRKALRQHATRSESAQRIQAMITLAQSRPGVPVLPADLNSDRWLINTPTATIDLRTGDAFPHRQTDLITKETNVAFDPSATCPMWDAFLQRATGDDDDLINYLRRVAGYSLTGDRSEQSLYFVYGPPGCSKSKFLDTMEWVMGGYADHTTFNTFLENIHGDKGSAEIARLDGTRLVVASEPTAGRKWDQSLINSVTGDWRVNARKLYAESFDFEPQVKIWLSSNDKPKTDGGDGGLWRRLKLIPFRRVIPESERDVDIFKKLQAEGSGILNWMLEGCREWQGLRSGGTSGLQEPDIVRRETEAYRSEMDSVGDFLADCTVTIRDAVVRSDVLYQGYTSWCDECDRDPVSQKKMSEKLGSLGYRKTRSQNGIQWHGLGMRE